MVTHPRIGGWIPDRPDHRDVPYSVLRPQSRLLRALVRPSSHYLRLDQLPPVFNQGNLGSCVGHGVAECLDYVEAKQRTPALLSRLAIYYWARGGVEEDTGAFIRDAIKAVARNGAPLESLWPYDLAKWKEAPSREAVLEGSHRAIGLTYYRCESLSDILDAIAQGYPVVFGTTLFESFESVTSSGDVPMPTGSERSIGGHCMAIVGYATKKRAVYVRNSWGPAWGYDGNCWIPFDYLNRFASDFWTVRRIAA